MPLSFVHTESPLYTNNPDQVRPGPTTYEVDLMHAVSRLVFNGLIDNIQTSWVKMGTQGVAVCLDAGANDVGGTLMNETITRAAGASHGQEWTVASMEAEIESLGRTPRQRNTVYADVSAERKKAARSAEPLREVVNTPASKYERSKRPAELVRNSVIASD